MARRGFLKYVLPRDRRTIAVFVLVEDENELKKIERRIERYGFITSYMRIQDYDEKGRPHVKAACYAVITKNLDSYDLKRSLTQLSHKSRCTVYWFD